MMNNKNCIHCKKEFKYHSMLTGKCGSGSEYFAVMNDNEQIITWHNVEDGLPEIKKIVLIKTENSIECGYRIANDNYHYMTISGLYIICNTLHWAELPKIKEG